MSNQSTGLEPPAPWDGFITPPPQSPHRTAMNNLADVMPEIFRTVPDTVVAHTNYDAPPLEGTLPPIESADSIAPANAEAYSKAIVTAALLGVRLTEERKLELKRMDSMQSMNTQLVTWRNAPTPRIEFSQEQREILAKVGNARSTPAYQEKKRIISDEESRIINRSREIDQAIARIRTTKEQLAMLEQLPCVGIEEEVHKVIESGHYELLGLTDRTISFTTQDIMCSDRQPDLGIDLSVYMGKYQVTIDLQTCNIKVQGWSDSLSVWGHSHPHLSSIGEPCWGNAKNTFYKAKAEFRISIMLQILHQLLQTYNPESPYVALTNFAFARDPNLISVEYKKSGEMVEVDEEYNDEYDEETENDSGDTVWLYDVYRAYAKGSNNGLNDDVYIKCPLQSCGYINVRHTNAQWRIH